MVNKNDNRTNLQTVLVMICTVIIAVPMSLKADVIDDSVVYWQLYHAPPATIEIGPSTGEGFVQRTERWLMAHLPEFTHSEEMVSIPQYLKFDTTNGTHCTSHVLHTAKRAERFVFSEPLYSLEPLKLLVDPDQMPLIRSAVEDGRANLSLLALQQRVSVGIPQGFTFEEHLVPGISAILSSPRTESGAITKVMLNLLENRRLDAVIIYPAFIRYYQEMGTLTREFTQLDIAGVSAFPLRVACTKTQIGNDVVKHVNELLKNPANTKALRTYYERWLN